MIELVKHPCREEELRNEYLTMYFNRMGLRAYPRGKKNHHTTIINWLEKWVSYYPIVILHFSVKKTKFGYGQQQIILKEVF